MEVARVLDAHAVKALFFLRGELFPQDSQGASEEEKHTVMLAKALASEGHLLGCHGLRHERLAFRSPQAVGRDLREASRRMESALGQPPRCFRPPYGSWAPWLSGIPERLGMRTIFWTLNPFDYARHTPEALLQRVLGLSKSEDILLLHCTGPAQENTLQTLPHLLDGLRHEGFHIMNPHALLEEGVIG